MQPQTNLWFDHAATSPVTEAVREAMRPYLAERAANASSLYAAARQARKAVDEAREIVAAAVGARPEEVVFTSGGTEADNLALKGVAWRGRAEGRDGIVIGATEHHAVLDAADWLEKTGCRVTVVPVDAEGVIDLDALGSTVDRTTSIVSIMAANNEVGTVQPIAACAAIARADGARFHTDAVQALAWIPVRAADADLIALSAHKLGGPQGVGAAVVRRGVGVEPLVHGGGQERGVRSGTYNVAGIVGFGAAVAERLGDRERTAERVRALRDRLERTLVERIGGVRVNGAGVERLPNVCSVCFEGVESEPLLLLLDAQGVAASSGSACQSGAAEPSHVLLAMGVPRQLALGALRLTLGPETTEADVDRVASIVEAAVERIRR